MKITWKKSYLFIALIGLVLVGCYFFSPGTPRTNSFTINQGESVVSIIDRLASAGVVRSRLAFKWFLSWSDQATHLQPGDHDLSDVISYPQLIARLAAGNEAAREAAILIKEGETLRDIKADLLAAGLTTASDGLYSLTGQPVGAATKSTAMFSDLRTQYDFLSALPAGANLEGFLFPDTYRFYFDASADDVVKKMLDNFKQKLSPELKVAINQSGHSLFEVVTMASILEQEVRTDADRRMVADIFWRRLKSGMALQADSTINYVIDGKTPSLSYEDLQLKSPYNSYKYAGLPPGPICNPGLAAIIAAANPEPNQYWYFLTDREGAVHYARTLNEHNRNKMKYLR